MTRRMSVQDSNESVNSHDVRDMDDESRENFLKAKRLEFAKRKEESSATESDYIWSNQTQSRAET